MRVFSLAVITLLSIGLPYSYAEKIARNNHVPVLIHVKELTQPLGHSSSGSHQRYKSDERLEWEKEYDCNKKMREWIISNGIADEKSISEIEQECKKIVKDDGFTRTPTERSFNF